MILLGVLLFAIVPGMPQAIDAPDNWHGRGVGLVDRWIICGRRTAFGSRACPHRSSSSGDVQVGPPTEGGEHAVRFTLTTEAGLNDGLAFPFVYLGLSLLAQGFALESWAVQWLGRDVLYRTIMGAAMGAGIGWLLGRILFVLPSGNALAETGSGVVALAGVLLCYGATELAEGYGFVAVFVSGLVLRRSEAQHEFHGKLHGFNEAIEHALTAILLILIGGALPALWGELHWQDVTIALALIFFIRPVGGWLALAGTDFKPQERLVCCQSKGLSAGQAGPAFDCDIHIGGFDIKSAELSPCSLGSDEAGSGPRKISSTKSPGRVTSQIASAMATGLTVECRVKSSRS